MDFKLNLAISDPDLRTLTSSEMQIVVAKPVGDSEPNVAWLVFQPFMGNTIEWSEEYGIYASITSIQHGAVIAKMSELPPKVTDGESYLFGKDQAAVFDPGDEYCAEGSFRIKNFMAASAYRQLTFGLTQKALINGKEIDATYVNAALVPSKLDVVFTPLTKIYVWLQHTCVTGTVITEITSTMTEVNFGNGHSGNSLVYDANKGHFIPAPGAAADNVLIHKRAMRK
jgi:hypothetical protein